MAKRSAAGAFTWFRGDPPGSAVSIAAGVHWLAAVEPKHESGLLFVPTLEALRQPTHLHDMLGKSAVEELLDARRADVRGRLLRLATELDLRSSRRSFQHTGPVLAMWPTLDHIRLLGVTFATSPIGVVVWSYEKDVEPLLSAEVD